MNRNQDRSPPAPPTAAAPRKSLIRRLLWLIVIGLTIPVVGFIVLIGAWIVLHPGR